MTLLEDKQLIFADARALARLHGPGGARGRDVFARRVPESHLPRAKFQREPGARARFGRQGTAAREEAVVGGLQVIPVIQVDESEQRVHAPRHVAVHGELAPLGAQVRVPLARDAVHVHLRMDGQVHVPFLRRRDALRKARDSVLGPAQVARMGLGLQGPPAVVVGDHEEPTVRAGLLAVRRHVAVLVGGEVATQVAFDEHGIGVSVVTGLLQGPHLLFLHGARRGVDFKTEHLRCQIFVVGVYQPEPNHQSLA